MKRRASSQGSERGLVIVSERAEPERGGVAVATSRIARLAAARGERVHLVSFSREVPPGLRRVHEDGGLTHHRVGRLDRDDDALQALADHARDVAVAERADVIHGMYATRAGYVATLAAAWTGAASVVSLRGNDLDRGLFRAADLPMLAHALRAADVVTAVSRELAHKASSAFARSVEYVPNSVDTAAFRPEARDNSLVASLGVGDGTVIGFVGELREKKGMRFLLPAFAKVAAARSARLLLIGGVRADAADAFAVFASTAPEAAARIATVEYSRGAKRLSRLLALCDIVVFPSLYDGMPNALLEAMAAARPVLVTDVGGHRDVVEHGRTGALLAPSELDALPQAIEELLDLPAEARAALGRAAREHVLSHHRPDDEGARYAEVYARARAARAKGRRALQPANGSAR
jgi:phosphatidylinositol alpha-1,6-mannosyltransferase